MMMHAAIAIIQDDNKNDHESKKSLLYAAIMCKTIICCMYIIPSGHTIFKEIECTKSLTIIFTHVYEHYVDIYTF